MILPIIRTASVLLTALVLQASLLTEIRVLGVSVDLMLVLAIAAGLELGPDRGALAGFTSGLLMDLLLQTPFGLSALTYLLVGYAVGRANALHLRAARGFDVMAAALAAASGVVVFVLCGELVGQPLLSTPDLGRIIAVVSVSSAILVVPAKTVVRWAGQPRAESHAVMV